MRTDTFIQWICFLLIFMWMKFVTRVILNCQFLFVFQMHSEGNSIKQIFLKKTQVVKPYFFGCWFRVLIRFFFVGVFDQCLTLIDAVKKSENQNFDIFTEVLMTKDLWFQYYWFKFDVRSRKQKDMICIHQHKPIT